MNPFKIQNRTEISRRIKLVKNGGTIAFTSSPPTSFIENSRQAGFCLTAITPLPAMVETIDSIILTSLPMGVDGRISLYVNDALVKSVRYLNKNLISDRQTFFAAEFGNYATFTTSGDNWAFTPTVSTDQFRLVFEDDDIDYLFNNFQQDPTSQNPTLIVQQYRLSFDLKKSRDVGISASYDSFYQTMTVTGEPGLMVDTKDPEGNIIGSGTIEPGGSVTYSLDEGMLLGGTLISTSSTESNTVTHPLVASFYLASDSENRNYLGFTAYRDLYLNWLDDAEFNGQYDESFLATLEGEMIVEYSTGETIIVNLADYQGSRWGFYLDRLGVNNGNNPSTVPDATVSAKVRFRNLNDQIYLWVNQGTHYYKFYDDGASNIGYGLAFRGSLSDAVIKQLPEYLPPIVTNLNCMFWGDQSDYYNQYLCENAQVESVLANWDVSNVKTMVDTFAYTSFHDLPISNWTPTSLELAIDTFAYTNYDNPINWLTPNLINTMYMFEGCLINSPINLTMDNVTNVEAMFDNAEFFNQPIGHWNVSNVTNFQGMFADAIAFNQNLNSWDVSSGTNFNAMFSGCTAYNQPMNTWDVSNTVNQNYTSGLYAFLSNATSYSQDLSMWCVTVHSASPTDGYSQFNANGIMTAAQLPVWGTCSVQQIPTIDQSLFTKMTYDQTNDSNVMWIDFEFAETNLNGEVYIDWGDGRVETHRTETYRNHGKDYVYIEHPYMVNGEYTIKVYSTEKLNWIEFGEITKLTDWGSPTNLQIQIPSSSLVEVPTTLHPDMTDLTYLFSGAPNFNQDISGWDTSNVTIMRSMFQGARAFNQNISGWDVSAVTNMQSMFQGAEAFNSPLGTWNTISVTNMSTMFSNAINFNQNIDTWNVSNVTTMSGMFNGASAFNQPLNSWNVSNVTDMSFMFHSAGWQYTHPLDNWDTSSVTNMSNMFALSDIHSPIGMWDVSSVTNMSRMFYMTGYNQDLSGWNTISVTDMSGMFLQTYLFNQDISMWNTSNVINMASMFESATAFNSPLNGWNTGKVTNMSAMFYGATAFNQPLNAWNTSSVTTMNRMFYSATAFNGDITSWNTSNVTDMGEMFYSAGSFNQPIGNWNTSSVTGMWWMFRSAISFNQPLDNWNTSNVTTMSGMFDGAWVFNQDLNSWDVSKVTIMNAMFQNAKEFNGQIGNWNTISVTNMGYMFYGALVFNQPIGNWNVSNVTILTSTFYKATAFNQDISGWNTANVTDMRWTFGEASSYNMPLNSWNTSKVTLMNSMFYKATVFNQPIDNWDVSKVTSMNYMFQLASNFNQPIGSWRTDNVTSMSWMFNNAVAFAQSLSTWCVSKILMKPTGFDTGATLFTVDKHPVWGTCPNPL